MPENRGPALELRAVYDHLAFLLSSAELCLYEPHYYGTLRLLDGASRFVRVVLDAGLDDPRMIDLGRRIEEAKSVRKSNPAEYEQLLLSLPAVVAEAIRALPNGLQP